MLVSDLLHSCANDRVAEAAVWSIGGTFALRMRAESEELGVSVGALVSIAVRSFAQRATERDWRDLAFAVRGQDHPVLAGLQLVLERRIRFVPHKDHEQAVPGFRRAMTVQLGTAAA